MRDFAAEAAALFARMGADVAAVTDGGFVMECMDAPRVLLYANSDLEYETGILSLPRPRHPRNVLRLWRTKRPFRKMIGAAKAKRSRSCRTAGTRGGRCPLPWGARCGGPSRACPSTWGALPPLHGATPGRGGPSRRGAFPPKSATRRP